MPTETVAEPDIFEAMRTQRAMRRLKPDAVPEEHIRKIIWAATQAPNGGNVQPWRFMVDRGPGEETRPPGDLRRRMGEVHGKQQSPAIRHRSPNQSVRRWSDPWTGGQYLADHLHEAPYLIIPCGFLLPINSGIASGSSIYPAIQNLMLAARALGLGTVLTTLHRQNEDAVRALLGIPENAHTAALIPVGWPIGRFGEGPRKPVEEVTYWDHWGAKARLKLQSHVCSASLSCGSGRGTEREGRPCPTPDPASGRYNGSIGPQEGNMTKLSIELTYCVP